MNLNKSKQTDTDLVLGVSIKKIGNTMKKVWRLRFIFADNNERSFFSNKGSIAVKIETLINIKQFLREL